MPNTYQIWRNKKDDDDMYVRWIVLCSAKKTVRGIIFSMLHKLSLSSQSYLSQNFRVLHKSKHTEQNKTHSLFLELGAGSIGDRESEIEL